MYNIFFEKCTGTCKTTFFLTLQLLDSIYSAFSCIILSNQILLFTALFSLFLVFKEWLL